VKPKSHRSGAYQLLFRYSFLGIGLYWAWIYLVCFSTLIYPQNENTVAFSQTGEYVSMLFYVAALLVSALMSKSLIHNVRLVKLLSAFPVLAGVGTLLIALSSNFGGYAFAAVMIGAALTGLGTGILLNMWGLLFTQMHASFASMRIALALFVSAVACILLSLLPFVAFITLASLLPLLSCCLAFIASNSEEFEPRKDAPLLHERNSSGESDKEGRQTYPWQLGIGLLSSGIPLGLVFGMTFTQVNMGKEIALICIFVNAGIGVLILTYLAATNRNLGFSTIYRLILPIATSGLLLVTAFNTRYIVFSLLLVRTGYALFDILIWLQLQKVFERVGTFKMFGLSRLCLDGGVLAGLTIYWVVVSYSPKSLIYFIIGASIFLIFTLPVVLTRRRVSNAWFLLPASSKEIEDFDNACREISERYHLTKRETEIMALIARGRNGAYIQERLYISLSTFQTHSKNIYRKLDIHSRQDLMSLFDKAIDSDKHNALMSARHFGRDKK
jgi:DNA-binding CsgD family transcriptional regulator